jgi:hypothetical protein
MGRGAGPTAQSLSFPTVAAAIRIAASYELKMRGARWLSTTAAILAVAALLWLARMSDSWRTSFSFTGRQVDYYNLLVHGFRQGHLYMDSDPDPALYSTDPDTRRRASYLQDASLFNHRYYLYYGVVPAALLFLPYSLATGGDLSANAAALVFVLAGFLFSLGIYGRARREYFPGIGAVLDALNVLLLGFATLGPLLVKCYGFYEVAVASGYAFTAASAYFLFRALHSPRGPWWLAASSLSLGLAVGCRPNYVLALPALAAAAWVMGSGWLRGGATRARRVPWRSLGPWVGAACLPAAAIGVMLAWYNYARFGNPLEFGFNYGMNAFTGTGRPVASLSFMWPNLRWYYLTPPTIAPYFPYCFSINATDLPPGYFSAESIHGQWIVGILLVVAALGLAFRGLRGPAAARPLLAFMAMIGWTALSGLIFMISLGVRADRYMTDFQSPLVLLIALSCGLFSAAAAGGAIPSLVWRACYGGVALAAVLFNFFVALEVFSNFEYLHPKAFARLARLGDYPIYELGKHGIVDYGPARFTATFAAVTKEAIAPLVASGAPNHMDILYAYQSPPATLELVMSHEGSVGLRSALMPITLGRPYAFEVDMGSLYPPRVSPFFDGWETMDVDRLKTTARVLMDGKEVLKGRVTFYDSSPGRVRFGSNPDEDGARFSGSVTGIGRLPARDPHGPGFMPEPGVWRADVVVPWLAPDTAHPLLGSGVTRHGNLLLVDVPARNTIQFGYDQWGVGISQSRTLAEPAGVHRIEIFVGAQVARQEWPAAWHLDAAALAGAASLLKVWLDGALVWTTPIKANEDSYELVSLGSNPQGFSTTDMMFPSAIEFKPYTRDETREFIARNLESAK